MMHRHRPWIALLLGLLLALQAMAVAAAPRAGAEVGGDTPATLTAPPCHEAMTGVAETPSAPSSSCCDEACPHMAACALGHLAAPATLLPLMVRPSLVTASPLADRLTLRPPAPRLRPPIVSHG